MPVFSALGADCTVFDYSDRQLEAERVVAEREGYKMNIKMCIRDRNSRGELSQRISRKWRD